MKKTSLVLALAVTAGLTSFAGNAKAQDNAIFYTTNSPGSTYGGATVSAWQGLKNYANTGDLLFVGTSGANGLAYTGPITGVGGSAYLYQAPDSTSTSIYGLDAPTTNNITLVGSYNPTFADPGNIYGFVATGVTLGSGTVSATSFIQVNPGGGHNYVHSTMGGYAVGNYDNQVIANPSNNESAFIYDISNASILPVAFAGPGVSDVTSTTLYAIWWNGGTSYTIAGGYDTNNNHGFNGVGFVANWNSSLGANGFSDWTSYTNTLHFEGISSLTNGVYTLSAAAANQDPALLTIDYSAISGFSSGQLITYGNSSTNWTNTTDDSVYGSNVVGIGIATSSGITAYSAVVSPVPEPSTYFLFGLGALALLIVARRKSA